MAVQRRQPAHDLERIVTTTNATHCQRRGRARYRPPAGVPLQRGTRWGAPLSVIVHLALIALLLAPALVQPERLVPRGAGGPGASGGGGGGGGSAPGAGPGARSGSAHVTERLHYTVISTQPVSPPAATQIPTPPLSPPERVETEPVPSETPVPEVLMARVEPVEPSIIASIEPSAPRVVLAAGAAGGAAGAGGGGVGAGAGPGSGGGVGSGAGTGRGSGTGSGSGGGEGEIYPATPDFLVMPALPVPAGVRGKTIELRFTLDEHGKIVKVDFDSTGDESYDRELRERLGEYRFRPAHKADGTPVPSVYVTRLTL